MSGLLQHTPLHSLHQELAAKLVPFAGYDMPVQYPDGIIKEHKHTRSIVGLFDVSHMGQITLHCPLAALAKLLPSDLAALAPMQTSYSLLLNEAGGIIDDLMVTRLNEAGDQWFLVVNASRKLIDHAHLRAHIPQATTNQLHNDRALLALQGPQAVTVMETLLPEAVKLRFMHAGSYFSKYGQLFVTRNNYTGKDDFEISVPAPQAITITKRLLADERVKHIGLGTRDTLRLETNLCLYGHELDETISPPEARLNWVIGNGRRAQADFPGSQRIMAEIGAKPARYRVGLMPEGRAIAREQTPIFDANGKSIGIVCSGGFSPTLERPIAMGFVPSEHSAVGSQVFLELRGQKIAAVVTKLPFVPHNYVR